MKKIITASLASLLLLASVPAFACGGEDHAKSGDDKVMTSVDDGKKDDADAKKTKKAKKDDKKDDKKSDETEEEGEV